MDHTPSQREARDYEIRVAGHLDPSRSRTFDGLAIRQQPDGDTVLAGTLSDQTALHALLDRIYDLGLHLLSVRELDSEAGEPRL